MDKDLEHALAFYQPAPEGWFAGIQRRMDAAGRWIWETLQGDFNDNPTTAQVATGTVISMIPLVDQLCDVRDLIANCKKIAESEEDEDNIWGWIALVLTLVGLFPMLGSLAKGSMKVMLLAGRRTVFRASTTRAGTPVAHALAASLDASMALLNDFLAMPAVRHTMKLMDIHKPYRYLEEQVRLLGRSLTVSELLAIFDRLLPVVRGLLDTVVSWGPASLRRPVEVLWALVTEIRSRADSMLARVVKPVQDYLDALANRLRIEGDNAYRAHVGDNSHVLGMERANKEKVFLDENKPDWVDKHVKPHYPALEDLSPNHLEAIEHGWPDIRLDSPNGALRGKFDTFDISMRAVEIPPGEKIYRIIDPSSSDNNICWMRESEFYKLTSKSDWRRDFAVWKSWNENGEYVVYTVPPGQPLKVWEGRAGTQINKVDKTYSLEGGATQIVLDPAQLQMAFTGPRLKTGWGYQDAPTDPVFPYLGLPKLEEKNNWYTPK